MANPFEAVFQFLENATEIPIDQIRFVVVILLGYPLAIVLRHVLHPDHTSLKVRYVYNLLTGVVLGLVCFGWESMVLLFVFVAVSYSLLRFISPAYTQRYSMICAMGFVSVVNIHRVITFYGEDPVDWSCTAMVMVQKISLVAYAVHDGKARKDSELNKDQREQKLTSIPGVLEYFSYMFTFQFLFVGPSSTFKEYQAFIDGSNFNTLRSNYASSNGVQSKQTIQKEPSTVVPALQRLTLAVTLLITSMLLSSYVDNDVVLDSQYSQPYRLLINYTNVFRIRGSFYFVWLLAESINIMAGFGYSGRDEKGRAKWDLVSNVKVWDIEFGTNLRAIVNGWNALTSMWLRRCVYERATFAPTMTAFAVSAWWHGFYPGYYWALLYLGVATLAARKLRRLLHHHFQGTASLRRGYDVVTWAVAHIYLDYGILCTKLMWTDSCLTYWSYYLYFPVISTVAIAVFFPSGKRVQKSNGLTSSQLTYSSKQNSS